MDPVLGEWLSLVLRWVHIITGVAWIGSTAADGFFWVRDKSNEIVEGLQADE